MYLCSMGERLFRPRDKTNVIVTFYHKDTFSRGILKIKIWIVRKKVAITIFFISVVWKKNKTKQKQNKQTKKVRCKLITKRKKVRIERCKENELWTIKSLYLEISLNCKLYNYFILFHFISWWKWVSIFIWCLYITVLFCRDCSDFQGRF